MNYCSFVKSRESAVGSKLTEFAEVGQIEARGGASESNASVPCEQSEVISNFRKSLQAFVRTLRRILFASLTLCEKVEPSCATYTSAEECSAKRSGVASSRTPPAFRHCSKVASVASPAIWNDLMKLASGKTTYRTKEPRKFPDKSKVAQLIVWDAGIEPECRHPEIGTLALCVVVAQRIPTCNDVLE